MTLVYIAISFICKRTTVVPPVLANGKFINEIKDKCCFFNDFFANKCSIISNSSCLTKKMNKKSQIPLMDDMMDRYINCVAMKYLGNSNRLFTFTEIKSCTWWSLFYLQKCRSKCSPTLYSKTLAAFSLYQWFIKRSSS